MKKIPYIIVVPIIFLIILLSTNVYLYRDNTLGGPNQLSLLLSGAVAALWELNMELIGKRLLMVFQVL